MEIIIIAALDENRVIGNKGQIPWHLPEDFKHFKETTMGHAVIMGRKTFVSLGNKPLPKRLNIVLTTDPQWKTTPDSIVCRSIEEAIAYAAKAGKEKAFIIGGANVYEQSLAVADQMILSHIPGKHEGDAFFPQWESEWKVVEEKKYPGFVVKVYKKN